MNIQPLRPNGSIEEVIEKYKNMVYRIALTRVKNQNDADDVFQEVFLVYFRKNPQFNEEEHQKAWLINTTINCSRKFIRENNVKTTSLDEIAESQICETVFTFENEQDTELYNAMCSLPEKYRTVLHLYYFEEMSVEEISTALHIKKGTIRMQMLRGRETLRKKLKGEYFYE